jgi:hypothetical protein
MKNRNKLRILTALLMMLVTGFILQAQTSQEAQKKKQAEMEKQIKETEMQLKKQQLEQEQKMQELARVYEDQARSTGRAREKSFVYASPSGSDAGTYFIQSYGQDSQSQLTLRNTFNGETLSSDGEFDVDESTSHIRLTVNGKVRHGEITIKVLYPGGKVFKDLTINSSAEITFSQSLTIKEEEKSKYVGVWKYEVKTKTAEGNYMLSIMTN